MKKNADRCDINIYLKGEPVLWLDGKSKRIEELVEKLREQTTAEIDWHYSAGVAQILFMPKPGENTKTKILESASTLLKEYNDILLLKQVETGESLYRRNVNPLPRSTAIALVFDQIYGTGNKSE